MTTQPTREPVTIRTCANVQEAEIVRSMLEAGGILAFIPDENAAGLWPPGVLEGVRVQVPADDAERALELLEGEE